MDFDVASLTAGLDGVRLNRDKDDQSSFIVDMYVLHNGRYSLVQEDARVTVQHISIQISDYFGDTVAYSIPIHTDFHLLPFCNMMFFVSQTNEHVALAFQTLTACEAFLHDVAQQNDMW